MAELSVRETKVLSGQRPEIIDLNAVFKNTAVTLNDGSQVSAQYIVGVVQGLEFLLASEEGREALQVYLDARFDRDVSEDLIDDLGSFAGYFLDKDFSKPSPDAKRIILDVLKLDENFKQYVDASVYEQQIASLAGDHLQVQFRDAGGAFHPSVKRRAVAAPSIVPTTEVVVSQESGGEPISARQALYKNVVEKDKRRLDGFMNTVLGQEMLKVEVAKGFDPRVAEELVMDFARSHGADRSSRNQTRSPAEIANDLGLASPYAAGYAVSIHAAPRKERAVEPSHEGGFTLLQFDSLDR